LIVIDASVAVQWVVPEPGYEASASLIRRDDLIAPDLLILEVANAFRRKIAAGEMTQEQAAVGIHRIQQRVGLRRPDIDLVMRSFDLSVQMRHPIYDCLYLATAEALAATFVTNDVELKDRIAKHRLGVVVGALPLVERK
jgi:predicted nucleic acid-binding protein